MSATLEKALVLIEAMAKARAPVGVTQLARELQLNKSTVYRLLEILCARGYARQDAVARSYMLTPRLWELGVAVLRNVSVHSVAPGFMQAAAAETGETLLLTIPDGPQALVIAKADSSQALQILSAIGSRVPLHVSSVGKAMMVDWPDERIRDHARAHARRVTPRTITDPDRLVEEVQAARALGYARSMDEWNEGVSGVAAPVRDATGAVVATLGITGPTLRLHPDRFAPLGRTAVAVAGAIGRMLGWNGATPPAS
ncbi:MAG: IclR family transcriptional regulator [Rhodobacteraceae bacterium]|nr:IclR family transcriptional regulator [Paracoccaceae bacterium]